MSIINIIEESCYLMRTAKCRFVISSNGDTKSLGNKKRVKQKIYKISSQDTDIEKLIFGMINFKKNLI